MDAPRRAAPDANNRIGRNWKQRSVAVFANCAHKNGERRLRDRVNPWPLYDVMLHEAKDLASIGPPSDGNKPEMFRFTQHDSAS
jgi:hypothetical protein